MTPKRKQQIIRNAEIAVSADIAKFANSGGVFARGLASEGYNGGYRDALQDVLLLLRGDTIPIRRNWWDAGTDPRR